MSSTGTIAARAKRQVWSVRASLLYEHAAKAGLIQLIAAAECRFQRRYAVVPGSTTYGLSLDGGVLRVWRDDPAFAQRFSTTLGAQHTHRSTILRFPEPASTTALVA